MPFWPPQEPPIARLTSRYCGLSKGHVREPVPSFRKVKYFWPSTKTSMWSAIPLHRVDVEVLPRVRDVDVAVFWVPIVWL